MAGLLICIVAIVIGFSYAPARVPGYFNIYITLGVFLSSAALCALMGARASQQMRRAIGLPGGRFAAAISFAKGRRLSWLAVLALYGICIHLFDYPHLVRSREWLGLGGVPLVSSVLVLLPFFLFAACNLAGLYRGEKLLRASTWGLWQYEGFYMRQFLVPVLPFLIFSAALDTLGYFPRAEESIYVYPSLLTAFFCLFILLLFTFAPLLFRFLWKVERLPDSPLRRRVEDIASSSSVRFHDIYIWHTGGSGIANAMVTGIFPRMRYIFVTEGLLAVLPEEEVVAVLAHELGHAKYRHMQMYVLLAISFIALVNSVDQYVVSMLSWMQERFGGSPDVYVAAYAFVLLLVFWGVIFGFTSRRLEQVADAFAAQKVSPQVFGSALERIGMLSGGPRAMSSWRHFPIGKRVRVMREMADGIATIRLGRPATVALAVVLIALVLGMVLFGYEVYSDATISPAVLLERRFAYAWAKKDYQRAVGLTDTLIRTEPENAYFHYLRGAGLDELGRLEESMAALQIAVELDSENKEYARQLKLLRQKIEKGK